MSDWQKNGTDEAEESKLDSILQPSTRAGSFKISVIFGYKISPNYSAAVDIARRHPSYMEKGEGEWVCHSVTFEKDDVEELFELFSLVHDWEKTEILVNHKSLPYGHQLWLPLMWFNRIK